jgi:uncharacterized phage protein (TIGR02218 family)
MKTISTALQTHLNSGTTTLCWCWKITRNDGVVQGFTDHDGDVPFGGVTYSAATGFTASEVQSSLGLSVDNLTVVGALSSDDINEHDLAAGKYDRAAIEIWRVNWASTDQRVLMRAGTLGEVKRGKTAFTAELRGLAEALNIPVGRAYNYACDADLGDSRCKINLTGAAYWGSGTVTTVTDGRRYIVSGLNSFAADWFSNGKLTWTSGANSGSAMEVKRHGLSAAAAAIELWQAMSEAVAVGDTFTITAGCDKQFKTCKTKFNNAANNRGFPYFPGNDVVISYPNSSQELDGGSRYGN